MKLSEKTYWKDKKKTENLIKQVTRENILKNSLHETIKSLKFMISDVQSNKVLLFPALHGTSNFIKCPQGLNWCLPKKAIRKAYSMTNIWPFLSTWIGREREKPIQRNFPAFRSPYLSAGSTSSHSSVYYRDQPKPYTNTSSFIAFLNEQKNIFSWIKWKKFQQRILKTKFLHILW